VANDRDLIPGAGNYNFNMTNQEESDLIDFVSNALTDPRVAAEQFPFDRPTLRSEAPPDNEAPGSAGNFREHGVAGTGTTLSWDPAPDNVGVADYRLSRDNVVIAMVTGTRFTDIGLDAETT